MAIADKGAWVELLKKRSMSEKIVKTLLDSGYESIEEMVSSFETCDAWMAHMKTLVVEQKLQDVEVKAEDWPTHALKGKCRLVWSDAEKMLQEESAKPAEVMGAPSGPLTALAPMGALKLGGVEKKQLEVAFKQKGGVLFDVDTPSDGLLNVLWTQMKGKAWKWVPWKQTVSRKAAILLLRKSEHQIKAKESSLVAFMAHAYGLEDECLDEVSGAAYQVEKIVSTRCNGVGMLGIVNVQASRTYVNSFMVGYTQRFAVVSGLRPLTVEEAEEIDRMAWSEVIRLVEDLDMTWDDAVHEVVVVRDYFNSHMQGRPKMSLPAKRPWGNPSDNGNWSAKGQHQQWDHGGGKGDQKAWKGKGKGKGKGKHGWGADSSNGHGGGPNNGGPTKKPKSGLCYNFQQGTCVKSTEDCTFIHICQKCFKPDHGSSGCR